MQQQIWMKAWFNLVAFLLYTGLSYVLALVFSPEGGINQAIIGGALAYGQQCALCPLVHLLHPSPHRGSEGDAGGQR
jgi:hypothetical protein